MKEKSTGNEICLALVLGEQYVIYYIMVYLFSWINLRVHLESPSALERSGLHSNMHLSSWLVSEGGPINFLRASLAGSNFYYQHQRKERIKEYVSLPVIYSNRWVQLLSDMNGKCASSLNHTKPVQSLLMKNIWF